MPLPTRVSSLAARSLSARVTSQYSDGQAATILANASSDQQRMPHSRMMAQLRKSTDLFTPAPGIYTIAIDPTLITTGRVTRGSTNIPNGSTDSVAGTTAGTPSLLSYTFTNNSAVLLTTADVAVDNFVNCTASVSIDVVVAQPAVEVLGTTSTRTTTEPDSKNTPVAGTSVFKVTVTPTVPGAWSFAIGTPANIDGNDPFIWAVTRNAA